MQLGDFGLARECPRKAILGLRLSREQREVSAAMRRRPSSVDSLVPSLSCLQSAHASWT